MAVVTSTIGASLRFIDGDGKGMFSIGKIKPGIGPGPVGELMGAATALSGRDARAAELTVTEALSEA